MPVTENDLLAFVDGQLDADRHAEVEAFLAENPDKAAEIAAWQNQNDAIKSLFDHVAKQPVPADLSAHAITRGLRYQRQSNWRLAAAAVVLLALGSGVGYFLRAETNAITSPADTLITAAIDAHELFARQAVHPVEVAADEAPHLTAWLSNNLNRALVTPDLDRLGYQLVGGRLLPNENGSAAQLMYESAPGQRITLYITPRGDNDQSVNKFASVDGLLALYWATEAITCTIVGGLTEAEMKAVAADVFAALSTADPNYKRG